MKRLNLRDNLEVAGAIIVFMAYLGGAGVKSLFEKTKKSVKQKMYQIQNKTKQRG